MPARPVVPSLPRHLPLAGCLAAVLGLTLTAAQAGPAQHVMRGSIVRNAVVPPAPLPFQKIASVLKPGSLPPGNPSATLHHVTSCNDDPNDAGSLRSILGAAGTVSGDRIDFAQLPMMCSTITLDPAIGALAVNQDTLYLDGPGAANLTIDGNNASRVLYHVGAGSLYISDLTIANGKYVGSGPAVGGCVYSAANVFLFESIVTHCTLTSSGANGAAGGGVFTVGNLTLVRSTITDAQVSSTSGAHTFGGGAYVDGSLFSHDSTVSNNSASANSPGAVKTFAGGVWVGSGADIENSTISGNSAVYVGGLELLNGSNALIFNSTISGNVGSTHYGGIWTNGPLTLANSTVAFNRTVSGSGAGSGLYSLGAPLTLQSSIIADNSGPHDVSDLGGPQGTQVSGTDNLIGSSTLSLPINNLVDVCPRLDPLADNGGFTRTHGLNHASAAIDHGNAGNSTVDQRGAPRPTGAGTDVGALERQPSDVDERILASNFDGLCDY